MVKRMPHPHPGEFGARIACLVVVLLACLPVAKADSLTLKPERKLRDKVILVDRQLYAHLQVNESTYFNFYSNSTEGNPILPLHDYSNIALFSRPQI